jgi:nitroreductase
MQVNEIIKNRKSIRRYKNESVSDEQVKSLLEAAMMAPSAVNKRPWQFIVVRNRDVLEKIMKINPFTRMLKTASLAIIVVAEQNKQLLAKGFFPQDCAAATENILLQAVHLGLGTCWCGIYPNEKRVTAIRELLNLPEKLAPFNVIAVGVPDETGGSRGFYEESKVSWVN